jgi:hypothetical protein
MRSCSCYSFCSVLNSFCFWAGGGTAQIKMHAKYTSATWQHLWLTTNTKKQVGVCVCVCVCARARAHKNMNLLKPTGYVMHHQV